MTRFQIVPQSSELTAQARSTVHPVNGQARRLSGWIEAEVTDGRVDVTQPAGDHLELEVDALRAENALVHKEIQRRIGGRRYPVIRADVQQVSALPGGRYGVKGELSLNGVTRPVAGEGAVDIGAAGAMQVDGEPTLDIRDFGLDPPKLLGLRVYPEVAVRLRVLATPDGR